MENIDWNNKNVVLEAVKQNGLALQFASEKLQDDKNVVLEAVKQYGRALRFASENLRDDKDIVMTAVQQNRYALMYASKELQEDYDIQKAAGLEPDKPDIDTVLGDAKKWCQEHNDTPTAQPKLNIER